MAIYDRGDMVHVTGTFTDSNSALVDPTTVTFQVKNPAGTTSTYVYGTDPEVSKQSTGLYTVDVSIPDLAASEGTWRYRWESTGTGQAAGEGQWSVRKSWT